MCKNINYDILKAMLYLMREKEGERQRFDDDLRIKIDISGTFSR